MGKVIEAAERFKNSRRKFVSPDGYDLCVICSCKTEFLHSVPVEERIGYSEAGQLCIKCYADALKRTF